jgi:hypothetical protein
MLNEKTYCTYLSWRRAMIQLGALPQDFDGDKDICFCVGYGEWTGDSGVAYARDNAELVAA